MTSQIDDETVKANFRKVVDWLKESECPPRGGIPVLKHLCNIWDTEECSSDFNFYMFSLAHATVCEGPDDFTQHAHLISMVELLAVFGLSSKISELILGAFVAGTCCQKAFDKAQS